MENQNQKPVVYEAPAFEVVDLVDSVGQSAGSTAQM